MSTYNLNMVSKYRSAILWFILTLYCFVLGSIFIQCQIFIDCYYVGNMLTV